VQTAPAEPLTIIRCFVSPGQPLTELQGLQDNKGNEWLRLPGETEQGLIDRASLECERNAVGIALLKG
jgi:hypothetical protein